MSANVACLYIDPVAGASGDMFLGALVDLGADFDKLTGMLSELRLPGFRLERKPVTRQTIGATKVDVIVDDNPQEHRHVSDLIRIIEQAHLPQRVRDRSSKILVRLAQAEARVHRMALEHVHLHEVGALDALVDVVGTCIGLELLSVSRIYSGPVSVGTGFVRCAHGKMPVPAPGTLAILEGFPIKRLSIDHEMTTPTGAAIIATLAAGFIEPLVLVPRRVGYGAADTDPREFTNVLRLVLAETNPRLFPAHYHATKLSPEPPASMTIDQPEGEHEHAHAHGHPHQH